MAFVAFYFVRYKQNRTKSIHFILLISSKLIHLKVRLDIVIVYPTVLSHFESIFTLYSKN